MHIRSLLNKVFIIIFIVKFIEYVTVAESTSASSKSVIICQMCGASQQALRKKCSKSLATTSQVAFNMLAYFGKKHYKKLLTITGVRLK